MFQFKVPMAMLNKYSKGLMIHHILTAVNTLIRKISWMEAINNEVLLFFCKDKITLTKAHEI